MQTLKNIVAIFSIASLLFTGCVSTNKYNQLKTDHDRAVADKDSLADNLSSLQKIQQLNRSKIDSLSNVIKQKNHRISATKDSLLAENEKKEILKKYQEYESKMGPKKINVDKKSQMVAEEQNLTDQAIIDLVKELVGEGVEVLTGTIKTNQQPGSNAYGTFIDSSRSFGISKGLLMTSGSIQNAIGPNLIGNSSTEIGTPGYEPLDNFFKAHKSYDACIIEFDIVPYADTLSFNYVFASEEYNEYVGTKFDDVFAFFMSGAGITGTKNIALIPGIDTYVSINNINNGNPISAYQPTNSAFYIDNYNNNNPNIGYDGYTKVLRIRQPVVANETYHLTLAIADVSDRILDSGLFIEGKSIRSYNHLYRVHFKTASYRLGDVAKKTLDKVLNEVKEAGQLKLEISGHTDFRGSESYNLNLSKNRNNSVVKYLESGGLEKKIIKVVARGESMPIADNSTAEGMQLNRRVEIMVLGSKAGTSEKE